MDNGIAFQIILVAIVAYATTNRLCINTQVADSHCLKKQTKCIKVMHKVVRR